MRGLVNLVMGWASTIDSKVWAIFGLTWVKRQPVYRSNVRFVNTNTSVIKSMQHLFLVIGILLFLSISLKTFCHKPARQQPNLRNWPQGILWKGVIILERVSWGSFEMPQPSWISNGNERSSFRGMWRASRQEKTLPTIIGQLWRKIWQTSLSLVTLASFKLIWSTHTQPVYKTWQHHGPSTLICPINPSGGHIWILVAIEYFLKWAEVIPLRKAIGATIGNFIREHIITRFGISHKIINDNDTPFVNKNVREILEHYRIKHRRSTPYYPKAMDKRRQSIACCYAFWVRWFFIMVKAGVLIL